MIKTYLGFDVGTKKTGIALSNSLTESAQGIAVVLHHKNGQTNWQDLDKIIKDYPPTAFIVGLPMHQGKMQEMSFVAKSFGKKLTNKYQKPVYFVDESLSSCEAKSQLKWDHNHKNADKTEVDKLASALILQSWINNQ